MVPIMEKRRLTLLSGIGLLCALITVFSACSRPALNADVSEDMGDMNITLEVGGDASGQVLTEIYAGVLRRSGYDVSIRKDFSAHKDYMKALEAGEADAVLVRSGKLLLTLDPKATQVSASDVAAALNDAIPSELAALKTAKYDDKEVLVTTAALAEKYKFRSTADMVRTCRSLTLGATADFAAAPYGLPLLKKKERCSFKAVRKFSGGQEKALVRALQKEEVQVANMLSSDPVIKDNSFVVVEDSNNSFVSQNFVPVIVKDKIGKKAQSLWNEVAAKLDGDSLTFLKREMAGNTKKTPVQAAEKWLDENGFKVQ